MVYKSRVTISHKNNIDEFSHSVINVRNCNICNLEQNYNKICYYLAPEEKLFTTKMQLKKNGDHIVIHCCIYDPDHYYEHLYDKICRFCLSHFGDNTKCLTNSTVLPLSSVVTQQRNDTQKNGDTLSTDNIKKQDIKSVMEDEIQNIKTTIEDGIVDNIISVMFTDVKNQDFTDKLIKDTRNELSKMNLSEKSNLLDKLLYCD